MLLLSCCIVSLCVVVIVVPLFTKLLIFVLGLAHILTWSAMSDLSWPILNILILKIPPRLLRHWRDPTLAKLFICVWCHLGRLHLDAVFLTEV